MKKIYKLIYDFFLKSIIKLEILKIYIVELMAIRRKKKLYSKIIWTKEQQNEFDNFWIKNYGKKIPNYWHKLYQSINGVFNVRYIPEMLYSTKFEYKLNDYWRSNIFSDKGLYDILFKTKISEEWKLPKTYLIRYRECFYDEKRNIISKEEASKIIEKITSCVIKPSIDSGSGVGVKLLDSSKKIRENFFDKEYEYSVLQERIIQSKDLNRLNPSSINTFRIMTYILNNKVYHAPISLRVGRSNSFLDNIHAGGMVLNVNEEGVLGEKAYVLGWGDKDRKYERHPDTNIIFKGYQIKGISKVISAVSKLHLRLPKIRMVSWDVTLDKDNTPVIVEANLLGQSVWFPQIISGEALFGVNTEEMLKYLNEREK